VPICAPTTPIVLEIHGRNKLETRLKHGDDRLIGVMLYAAKCYWPGVNQTVFEQVTARAAGADSKPGGGAVNYRGSLLFSDDDLVLCLFEAPSRIAVKRASERVGIPCERVMDSVWLEPDPSLLKGERK
jgi:hypothetical protein